MKKEMIKKKLFANLSKDDKDTIIYEYCDNHYDEAEDVAETIMESGSYSYQITVEQIARDFDEMDVEDQCDALLIRLDNPAPPNPRKMAIKSLNKLGIHTTEEQFDSLIAKFNASTEVEEEEEEVGGNR